MKIKMKKRMRSRGGKESERKDKNEGRESKTQPGRGSCKNLKGWRKRW